MSSRSKELLPIPPYIGVRPPTDMAKRDRRKVVYGFPLTNEWLQYRYHHEVELEAPKAEGVRIEERGEYLVKFAWYISGVCQKIHQVKCTTTIVQTSGYRGGRAMFLIVGYPGRKPDPDTLRILIDTLADYGIVEVPGWYPRA